MHFQNECSMNHEVLVLGARSLYELFNECMHRRPWPPCARFGQFCHETALTGFLNTSRHNNLVSQARDTHGHSNLQQNPVRGGYPMLIENG
jgi:hypothetical protein